MSEKKDWTGNYNSIFKQLGASSHTEEEREEYDYYATDPKAIDDLLAREHFSKYIWEPASGGGHLVDKLREHGHVVLSSDIVDRGHQDFLYDFINAEPLLMLNANNGVVCCGSDWGSDIDNIMATHLKDDFDVITNPPYKYVTDFVLEALSLVKTGRKVAMFLKLTTLEGQDRYKRIYKDNPPARIYVYSRRIQCVKNGDFEHGAGAGSAVCYAWFVWEKGFHGDPVIKWIF